MLIEQKAFSSGEGAERSEADEESINMKCY